MASTRHGSTGSTRGRPRGSNDQQLLDVARALFVEHGFRGTTMDGIAARAHVSKQSLYRAHPSKDQLYAAVVRDWVRRGSDAMHPHVADLAAADSARTGLRLMARVLQAGVLSEPVLRMRTLIASEAARFPDVAADYAVGSWARNIDMLAESLCTLTDRGLLRADDPRVAAEQFTWLVVAAPLNRLTLQAGGHPYSDAELTEVAEQGVETFLSRFGTARP